MKWTSFSITTLLLVLIVWLIGFMHNTTAIMVLLGISLPMGFIFQQSREDMPARPKSIISGFMLGTYAALVIIPCLIYLKFIVLN